MNKNLLIIGTGSYGIIAKETAESMNCFDKIDFLDDENNEITIGKLKDYEKLSVSYRYAFVAFEDSDLRLKWIQKLEESCYIVAILVHPTAYISPSVQLMKGTIVEPMAVVQANTVVAIGCIISAGAVIRHNCFIGDACHIASNSTVTSRTIMFAGSQTICGQVFKNNKTSE
jgi:UDP-3-O-[3-hydroxymyristoyl] glucosamine N-acyltransferase